MGSKSTFAYFSLTRKVGRRRHNTIQYTVGYRKNDIRPRQKGKKQPVPASEGTKKEERRGESRKNFRSPAAHAA